MMLILDNWKHERSFGLNKEELYKEILVFFSKLINSLVYFPLWDISTSMLEVV